MFALLKKKKNLLNNSLSHPAFSSMQTKFVLSIEIAFLPVHIVFVQYNSKHTIHSFCSTTEKRFFSILFFCF